MTNPMKFLKYVLVTDGITSGVTGVLLAALPSTVAALIGVSSSLVVTGVGLGLILFGAALIYYGRRDAVVRATALTAGVLNLAWLGGTAVILLGGWLNLMGSWAIALVGDVVLVFTVLEYIGLRKLERLDHGAATRHA